MKNQKFFLRLTSFFRSLFLSIRPKTLSAALVPCMVSTALAWKYQGDFSPGIFALALASALFIQIGTNLVNDAMDFKKGADTAERLGPLRVTQAGLFTSKQVLVLAFLSFAVAALLGFPLVLKGGLPVVLIGVFSLLMAYAYTGGPFPLAYKGLGDLFVLIFFGWVAVGGLFYLHTGAFTLDAWILGTQVGLLSTVLIAINNLRDHQGDALVGKKTLAVRWGVSFAKGEILILLLTPFLLNLYWGIFKGMWLTAWLVFIVSPLALKIITMIFKNKPGIIYNKILAMSAALQLLFGILWVMGLCFE